MFDSSPTDTLPSPLSPGSPSPYQMSPVSPMSPTREAFRYSSTPTASTMTPSGPLPRLVTSFNSSTNHFNTNHSSVDCQMSTPMPPRLDQSPVSVGLTQQQRWEKMVGQGCPDAVSRRNAIVPMDICASEDPSPSRQGIKPDFHVPRMSTEQSETAMEGLEQTGAHLHTPTCDPPISLPLRINTSRSSPSTPPPWRLGEHSRQGSTLPRIPCRKSQQVSGRSSFCRPCSPTTKCTHRIHRRRAFRLTHRRNASNTTTDGSRRPVRLVVCPPIPHPLVHSLNHLRTPLVPLISVLTGIPHPDFPTSLLQYHLLTHDQLDSLARWYHQTIDSGAERWMYPAPIELGKVWTTRVPVLLTTVRSVANNIEMIREVDLEDKRRRWGRFIGLRDCESPTKAERDGSDEAHDGDDEDDDVIKKMEKQWKNAMRRAEEEDKLREKVWRGRF